MRLALLCIPLAVWAASVPEATVAPRTTPPTINTLSPMGAAQGKTTEFKIDGSNLADAKAVFFSQPGIHARIKHIEHLPPPPDNRLGSAGLKSTIDLGPVPERTVVTIEAEIDKTAELGPVALRLQTPLGLTTPVRFMVEPDCRILVGTIAKPGKVDSHQFTAEAGDRIVFYNGAMQVGSALRPALTILDAGGKVVREFSRNNPTGIDAHEFTASGEYTLRITDFEHGGSPRHFYRIAIGKLPVVLSSFPVAAQRGVETKLALNGWNLPSRTISTTAGKLDDAMMLRPEGSLNKLRVPVTEARPLVQIDDRLTTDHRDVRFRARKGEPLLVEVLAARAGSPLDSVLEIFDANGKPIERATIRATAETSTTLNDRDSMQAGLRLLATTGYNVGDYILVGGEILKVAITPHGPDEDTFFDSFNGQRIAYLDTTGEGHAMDSPVYKIQILPPGSNPAANGLPLLHLTYRNDDGGPGYGKDSLIHFTSPADGEYIARLSDVRGRKGDDLAFRITVRPPRPDYRLALKTQIANVPAGGSVPVTVVATRMEGHDAPIHLSMKTLPTGLHATSATIPSGENSATLVVSADADVHLDAPVPLLIQDDTGREASPADQLRLIAVTRPADIGMTAKTREIHLTPGTKAQITVDIARHNGFAGRVPVEVRDLPQEIVVANVGLNGVLINETETTRTFTIEALPNARPGEQTIVVAGKVETRAAGQENSFAGEPIRVVVK